jgi:hypothetical protein
MWWPQRQWWDSTKFIKALITGYGGGKTLISGKRAISIALHNDGSPHLYISPSYKVAKRTIIPTLNQLLDGRGIKYKFNKSDFEYKFSYKGHKALIWIGSGDSPDSLKGPNVGSGNIDEPFIQPIEVFNQLLARVRDPKAKLREIGLTGTPEDLNWGYDVCDGDEKHKYDIELIQASTLENKALPADYVKTLSSAYDERTAAAYINGQFINLNAGAVYYSYDKDLNGTTMDISEDRVIMVGMDFNVDPMSATLSHDVKGKLYACDEIVLRNSNTERLCKAILERYPRGRFIVYPDSTGKSRSSKGVTDFVIIKEVFGDRLDSLEYPRKNPYLKDRFNAVNSMLCNTKGERKAFVNANKCPELVKDLQQTTFPYEEYKRKNPKRTHFSDNWGYNISRAYPIYRRGSIEVS